LLIWCRVLFLLLMQREKVGHGSLMGLNAPFAADWVRITRPGGNDFTDEQGYGMLIYSLNPTLPGPYNGGPHIITAINSGLALGVAGGSALAGAQIEQRAYP
jgi:hypothetical protein